MLTGLPVWNLLRLALILASIGVFTSALVILGMAIALLCPPRMTGGRAMFFLRRLSPTDLGLDYQEMNFQVRGRPSRKMIRIAGWWLAHPQPSGRCAVILHGYGDSKIGGIAWAPLLQSLGFNVLAIDLRAHGESQGRFSTAGFHERYDVCQVIDELKVLQKQQTAQIVLMGVSLGASVATATAGLRDDLAAVILECPFADYRRAVLSQADKLPVPGRTFQKLALWLSQKISRADFSQVRPLDLIGKIRCPLLLVQSSDDPFLPNGDAQAVADAATSQAGRVEVWSVQDSYHALAMAEQPLEYRRRLAAFLQKVDISSQVSSK